MISNRRYLKKYILCRYKIIIYKRGKYYNILIPLTLYAIKEFFIFM